MLTRTWLSAQAEASTHPTHQSHCRILTAALDGFSRFTRTNLNLSSFSHLSNLRCSDRTRDELTPCGSAPSDGLELLARAARIDDHLRRGRIAKTVAQ